MFCHCTIDMSIFESVVMCSISKVFYKINELTLKLQLGNIFHKHMVDFFLNISSCELCVTKSAVFCDSHTQPVRGVPPCPQAVGCTKK